MYHLINISGCDSTELFLKLEELKDALIVACSTDTASHAV